MIVHKDDRDGIMRAARGGLAGFAEHVARA
jgi:hypothetical protein